jgi:hypothetical protein
MSKLFATSLLCLFLVPMACAQHLWIDASQFNKADICADIQAAIAALPIVPSTAISSGIVIDARNFGPPATNGALSCSVNPFALFSSSLPQNPIVLAAQGTSSTPGNQGGIVLLPGYTIATNVPWLVPQSWSIIGQGSHVTFLAPSTSFPTPSSPNTVSTSGTSNPVTLSTGTWPTAVVGSILFACPSGCTAGYQTATAAGIVTDLLAGNATLNLGTAVNLSSGSPYLFQTPLLAWATTTACPTNCGGALQVNTPGSVIQDIGLDCSQNGQGVTVVPGCIPFWDEYGQERSQLKRIRITNFPSLGIGIYGAMAQNGGPFDDIQLVFSGTITSATTCVEVGGTGLGTSNQPSMRGIRGLTCVGPAPSTLGTGIDINTQNFSLSDAHFEDFNVGVEVGALTSARGIFVSDVTGGGNGASVNTVVDISSNCATNSGTNCQSFATSDINLQNIYQSSTTSGVFALQDHISGSPRTTNEATLGLYHLGDGSGSGTSSTRPVLTTSSTFGSSPNLIGMASGTPVTGVQGTGTVVQMSTGGTFTNGHLVEFDGSGDAVDSGIPAAYIASPATFFTNAFGTSTTAALANTTIKLWGFSLPNAITTTAITYDVSTADSTNSYSFGIYNSSGTQVVAVGPATTLVNTTLGKTASWTTGSGTTLAPGKYYFATATNCASSCASLSATSTSSFAVNANGGTATGGGGFPAGTLTIPADNWAFGSTPTFTIH